MGLPFPPKRTIKLAMGTSASWTPERRARQAEAIRRWRPWDQSTGPRSPEGKERSSRNADKGIARQQADFRDVRLQVRAGFAVKAEEALRRLQAFQAKVD